MLSFHAMAYDFSYNYQGNTLYYNITSDNTVEVTYYSSDNYFQNNNYVNGDVVIPSSVTNNGTTYSVTSIGASAFSYCSGLTSVTIPNSVTSIGEVVFAYCSGLTSVTLPNNATIHSRAFMGAGEKTTIDSVIYCNDTLIVGNYTFIGTGFLTFYLNENSYFPNNNAVVFDCYSSKSGDLIIPSTISYNGTTYSVTSIGEWAFSYCSGLTSITIGNSVTSIGNSAFEGCSGLTSITIGNSVTSIGKWAFAWCSELTSVTIPNSVTSIADYAFHSCSSLTSVTIPNSVTWIGEGAFHSCSGLTSVTIGNSVTSIGYRAFYNCSGLTSIVSKATVPPELDGEVFPKPNSCNVTAPCGSFEAYIASLWNGYFPSRIDEDCSSALQEVESTR